MNLKLLMTIFFLSFSLVSISISQNWERTDMGYANTEIFKIVAPILVSRGITRIVSGDKLIAL